MSTESGDGWKKFADFVRSPRFHSALIDNCVINVRTDGVTTRIEVTLLRDGVAWKHIAVREETVSEKSGEQGFGGLVPEKEICSIQEFEAILEPHDALRFAALIVSTVMGLPEEQRERYDIPAEIPTADGDSNKESGSGDSS